KRPNLGAGLDPGVENGRNRRQQIQVRQPDHHTCDPRDPGRLALERCLHAPRHPLIARELCDVALSAAGRRPAATTPRSRRCRDLDRSRTRAASPLATSAATTRATIPTAISISGGTTLDGPTPASASTNRITPPKMSVIPNPPNT